jgi:hypothetical protein
MQSSIRNPLKININFFIILMKVNDQIQLQLL